MNNEDLFRASLQEYLNQNDKHSFHPLSFLLRKGNPEENLRNLIEANKSFASEVTWTDHAYDLHQIGQLGLNYRDAITKNIPGKHSFGIELSLPLRPLDRQVIKENGFNIFDYVIISFHERTRNERYDEENIEIPESSRGIQVLYSQIERDIEFCLKNIDKDEIIYGHPFSEFFYKIFQGKEVVTPEMFLKFFSKNSPIFELTLEVNLSPIKRMGMRYLKSILQYIELKNPKLSFGSDIHVISRNMGIYDLREERINQVINSIGEEPKLIKLLENLA